MFGSVGYLTKHSDIEREVAVFMRSKLFSLFTAICIVFFISSGCNKKGGNVSLPENTGTSISETSQTVTESITDGTTTETTASSRASAPKYGIPSLARPANLLPTNPAPSPGETVSVKPWDGPAGYVIVVSVSADAKTLKGAEKLKAYMQSAFGVSLNIVKDSEPETAKEILFGKTNRSQSEILPVGDYAVTLKGKKLVFEAGHWNTLNMALDRFIRENKKPGVVRESRESTSFETQKLGKYQFVWSDEFEGETLDTTIWRSSGPFFGVRPDTTLKWLDEPSILKVADGLLQMNARRWFDPSNFTVKWAVPEYLNTSGGMNFTYGYLEMRAMIPYEQAAFPAWWLCNTPESRNNMDMLGEKKAPYSTEIDIVEVFAFTDTFSCAVHQWPRGEAGSEYLEHEEKTFGTGKNGNVFENAANLSNEYHVYAFEWTPTEMAIYVDGVKKQTQKIADIGFSGGDAGFHDPLYIMLDNNIFTPLDGKKVNRDGGANALTSFPKRFYVDYIRLYQKPAEGKLWLSQ